jgi:hypothetical protein
LPEGFDVREFVAGALLVSLFCSGIDGFSPNIESFIDRSDKLGIGEALERLRFT